VVVGFVIGIALLLLVGEWGRRSLVPFYDAYVARYGGPTRTRIRDDVVGNPLVAYQRLYRRDGVHLAQLYVPLDDTALEKLRRTAALATSATFVVFVLQLPLWEFADALASSLPLPSNWLITRATSSISLVVAGSSFVQWLVASVKPTSPAWWRWVCAIGVAGGIVGFFVIRAM